MPVYCYTVHISENKIVWVSRDVILPSSIRGEIFCLCNIKFRFEIECLNQSNSNRNDKIPSSSET